MRLRAQITIDMEACDYIAAADFQRRMQGLMEDVRKQYEQAGLELKECRGPPASRSRPRSNYPMERSTFSTGALNRYEDG